MRQVPGNRYVIFLLLVGAGAVLDLWSKSYVFAQLGAPGGRTGWLLDGWLKFELHTSFNSGALWGLGQGKAWLFALLSVGAFLGVLYWLFVLQAAKSMWLTVTLGLISGGTLGNLYDRLALHGWTHPVTGEPLQAVRDFLRFRFGTFDWATFNVADILLVVGAIMLVIQSFFAEQVETGSEPVVQGNAAKSAN
ncbi:MAG: signal peptidase II [Planctomycetaceae bacterium]